MNSKTIRFALTEEDCKAKEVEYEFSLEEFDIYDVVQHFEEDELLETMGFEPDLCFKDFYSLERYVEGNLEDFQTSLPLAPEFTYHNESDIYNRMVALLQSTTFDGWIYEELDKYLTEKGF